MRSKLSSGFAVATTVVVALLLGPGCSSELSEAELVASAKEALAKNDQKLALVQLKTALQKNPQAGEARFLLGDTMFKAGDMIGALAELERAREQRYSDDLVLPLLAQALLITGQFKKVNDGFASTTVADPQANAALKSMVAAAQLSLGDMQAGSANVQAALKSDPKNLAARLLQARLTAGRGAYDEAVALVDALIADDPKRAEAWQLKGELVSVGKSDVDGGIAAFRQALVIEPKFLPAHAALIRLLMQKQDVEGYKAQVAELGKRLPNNPASMFYDVQLALFNQEIKRAQDGAQLLVRAAPNDPQALQLAGLVDFQAGALQSASSHLLKAVQIAPSLPGARRLLAETYLRSAQPAKALSVLQPQLDDAKPDAELLALAAEAYLQLGDSAKAELLFSRAVKANPNDPKLRTAQALSQFGKGNAAAGFAQLESLASTDPGTYPDLALISARLRGNDLDGALTAVNRLQEKLRDKPLPHLLRGQILQRRKDLAGARTSFTKALALDAAYFPATAALAALDGLEGKPEQALKRFEDLLAADPKNYQALLAVVELRRRAGAKPEEITTLLSDAVQLNPTEVTARLLLIDHQMAQRQTKAALSAAQDALAAAPENLQVMDALGRAQLAAGDTQQAINSFKKIVVAQPNAFQPHLRLADAYMLAKDYPSADQSLRKALAISPKLLVAQRGLIQLALANKRVDEALQVAQTVQKERPQEAVGHLLEAEIHAGRRAWDPAIAATRQALDREKTAEIAIRLHTLYGTAGRAAEADTFAASWLKDHPRDVDFLFRMGTMALDRKDYAAAEARYRQVLAVAPDNVSSANNLAWLLIKQGKPGALKFAEQAQQMAPDQAFVLDTLALANANEKQWAKAVEWQQKAVARAPDIPGYRLSLARFLLESGNRPAAKTELDKLAALGNDFADQGEVAQLLKGL